MKLWDKIWTTIFLIIVIVFSATMAYEFFFIKATYLKKEEVRMEQVAQSYEKKLKEYLYKKSELAKSDYIYKDKPIVSKLKNQDTFVFVEGKKGIWNNIGEENLSLKRTEKGYFISEENIIYGSVQEIDGSSYIFKLNKDELILDPKWRYYDVTIEPYTAKGEIDNKIKLEYDYFEKKYFISVPGGRLMITLKRGGVLYNSVMLEGRKVFIIGLGAIAFLILLIAGLLEKRIACTIKKAAKKMESVLLTDEINGEINLGKIPEFKILERGLNNIVKSFNDRERKYRLLYDELPLFSAILDLDLNIIEENNYFKKNLKKPEEEKEAFLDYIPKDKVNLFTAIYRKLETSGEALNENFYMVDNNSNIRSVILTMKKANIENGREVILFTAIDTEYLDIKQIESRSADKYDLVTNVYTEKYGHYYLEKYINMCKISNFSFLSVVLWTDFEKIAEKLSDKKRVEYLNVMASSIKKCLRGTDLIYKFDRNSFALLFSMVKVSEVNIILRRIRKEIESNRKALGVEEVKLDYSITEYDSMSSKKFFIEKQLKDVEIKKQKIVRDRRLREEKMSESKRS